MPSTSKYFTLIYICIYICINAQYINGSNSDCMNPLFYQQVNHGVPEWLGSISLLSSPQMTNGLTTCSNWNDKMSCCNSTTFHVVQSQLTKIDASIKLSMQYLPSFSSKQLVAMINQYLVSRNMAPMSSQTSSMFDDLWNSVKNIINSLVHCYGGILGYLEGMLCFACEPNYLNYIQVYNSTSVAMKLTQSTCDSAYSQCSGFIDDTSSFSVQVIDFMIQVISEQSTMSPSEKQAMLTQLQQQKQKLQSQGLCGPTGCQSILCNHILKGLNISVDMPSTNPLPSIEAMMSPFVIYNSEQQPIHHELLSTIHMFNILNVFGSFEHTLTNSIAQVSNIYLSNSDPHAYAAYDIGCEYGSMSDYACPSPDTSSKKTTIIIAVVVSLVVLLIIVSVIVLIRYKRRAANGSQPSAVSLNFGPSSLNYQPVPNSSHV